MSICPRHRDAYGVRWRCRKKLCSVPSDWSVHKKKELKGDQGLTLPQSQLLYRLTSVLVPVASRKSNFFQFIDFNSCLRRRMFFIARNSEPDKLRTIDSLSIKNFVFLAFDWSINFENHCRFNMATRDRPSVGFSCFGTRFLQQMPRFLSRLPCR